MLKIKGTYRGRTETIDRFYSQDEADRCLVEYRLAFGPDWTLWLVGRNSPVREKIIALRLAGRTNGQIATELQTNRFSVDSYTSKLQQEGVIPKRTAGTRPKPLVSERNQKIIALVKAGKGPKEVSIELGIDYYTARSAVHRLRRRGAFDDNNPQ